MAPAQINRSGSDEEDMANELLDDVQDGMYDYAIAMLHAYRMRAQQIEAARRVPGITDNEMAELQREDLALQAELLRMQRILEANNQAIFDLRLDIARISTH